MSPNKFYFISFIVCSIFISLFFIPRHSTSNGETITPEMAQKINYSKSIFYTSDGQVCSIDKDGFFKCKPNLNHKIKQNRSYRCELDQDNNLNCKKEEAIREIVNCNLTDNKPICWLYSK